VTKAAAGAATNGQAERPTRQTNWCSQWSVMSTAIGVATPIAQITGTLNCQISSRTTSRVLAPSADCWEA
jgi:hypothetical protein